MAAAVEAEERVRNKYADQLLGMLWESKAKDLLETTPAAAAAAAAAAAPAAMRASAMISTTSTAEHATRGI